MAIQILGHLRVGVDGIIDSIAWVTCIFFEILKINN